MNVSLELFLVPHVFDGCERISSLPGIIHILTVHLVESGDSCDGIRLALRGVALLLVLLDLEHVLDFCDLTLKFQHLLRTGTSWSTSTSDRGLSAFALLLHESLGRVLQQLLILSLCLTNLDLFPGNIISQLLNTRVVDG